MWFDWVRVLPLIAVLTYASVADYRRGEVSNRVWLYAPFGFVLTVANYVFFEPSNLIAALAWSCVLSLLAIALFYFPKIGIGGADSKAFITISVSFPLLVVGRVVLPFLMFVLATASLIALLVVVLKSLLKMPKVEVRFLPYLLIGTVATLVLFL